MPSISNIFLFNDIIIVRVGVDSPSNFSSLPTTDDQNRDFFITIDGNTYAFVYPYGWNIPLNTEIKEGKLTYKWISPGRRLNGYVNDYWEISVSSNLIMVNGLESSPATITFLEGVIEKNGVSVGTSTTVVDGDTIKISVSDYTAITNQPTTFSIDVDGTTIPWVVELSDPSVTPLDTDVTKSSPDNPNSIEKMPIETKNNTKNEITELKTSSSTTRPSYLGENTP